MAQLRSAGSCEGLDPTYVSIRFRRRLCTHGLGGATYDVAVCGATIWQRIRSMKATLDGKVIAESDDIVECRGYQYFPSPSVRMDWLEKAQKTESDHACPHGVQFYDVVIGGVRHPRAAWSYEAPRPAMQQVAGRFGFWEDVEVG